MRYFSQQRVIEAQRMTRSIVFVFVMSLTAPFCAWAQVGVTPAPKDGVAIDFAARKKAYLYDYAATKKLVIQKIQARTAQINNMINLLEARSPEKIHSALDLMAGKNEQDPAKKQETKEFYDGYLNGVLDFGDDADKARAAEFLRALAAAAPLAGGREEVGRGKFFLRGNLEGAMIMTGEQESLAQSYMEMPPERLGQWLLTTRVYAELQPNAAH